MRGWHDRIAEAAAGGTEAVVLIPNLRPVFKAKLTLALVDGVGYSPGGIGV
jgi:hypothetical protein